MEKRPPKQMAESLWRIRRLLERLRNDPASSKLPVAYDFTDDHLVEGIARPIDELLMAIQAAKEAVAHVLPPQAERVVSTLATLRERLMTVKDNASVAYGTAGVFGPSLEAAKMCMYRGICAIWESYQAALLDIACELETYGSLGLDDGRDRRLACASTQHKRCDDQGYAPAARPTQRTTMMHEEMLGLHRAITREIHKKHRDFFRGNWDKFCAWADETARMCRPYWEEQTGEYRKWENEVLHPRWQRINDTVRKAMEHRDRESAKAGVGSERYWELWRRYDAELRELCARAEKCHEQLRHQERVHAAKLKNVCLDLERQGWVRCSARKKDYGFFSIPLWHGAFLVPPDFVNPVGWVFGLKQPREPTVGERLLCDCALLSVLHDSTVEGADPRICAWGFRPTYGWERFKDWEFRAGYGLDLRKDSGPHSFVSELHGHLAAMTQDGQIQRAWDRVKALLPQDDRNGPRLASPPISQEPTDVNTQSMKWDAFISYASEDEEAFVRPLAEALLKENIRVWFAKLTLTVGDSLRRSIDHGLASSRYGIVIISPSFLAKEWPQKELDGLAAREVDGLKVILPVWHNMDAETLRRCSPLLADRVATSTAKGVQAVVADLMKAMQ